MRPRRPSQQHRSSPAIADGSQRKECRQSSLFSARLFLVAATGARVKSVIVRRSLRQFRLHDETVLCRIDVAVQYAKCDFHELRIALTDLDVAGLELLAIAYEYDGAVLEGLQGRGFQRDPDLLCRKNQRAAGE